MPLSNKYFYRYRGQSYPTVKYLLYAHDLMLSLSEGRAGVADRGKLESAARQPVQSAGGEDAYGTFFAKVAALGVRLAHDHGFNDGNKRTSLFVMRSTLEENGYYPDPSDREAATVMVLIAMGLLDIPATRIALMLWCEIDPADTTA